MTPLTTITDEELDTLTEGDKLLLIRRLHDSRQRGLVREHEARKERVRQQLARQGADRPVAPSESFQVQASKVYGGESKS